MWFVAFFVNFTLGYAVRKVEENGDGLELHGTHRAGDVNLLAKNINSI
jgi:hypothetical protein